MIKVRQADNKDNAQLHSLSESLPMEGSFSLRIERKPDFFALLGKRGKSMTFVTSEKGKIDGCISISAKEYSILGKAYLAGIISDVKFLKGSNPMGFARLLHHTNDALNQQRLHPLLAVVADGNVAIENILSGRIGLPRFNRIGRFEILQILSKKKSEPRLRRVFKADDLKSRSILELYNSYLEKFDLANRPVPMDNEFEEEFYCENNGEIIAAIRLSDMSGHKQNVVLRAPAIVKIILRLLRLLKKPLGLPEAPSVGSPVEMLYVRYYAHAEGYESALLELIDHARTRAFEKGYGLLSIALCEKLEILKTIKKRFFHITFRSSLFQAQFKDLENSDKLLCFEDFAVV